MRILIDGSNLVEGGAVTHILEILKIWKSDQDNEIFIICSSQLAEKLKKIDGIQIHVIRAFNSNIIRRNLWLILNSKSWCEKHKIDILFNPGGGYLGRFRPYVTMSRNMLIFDKRERARYGFSYIYFRLLILNLIHSRSIKQAQGIIFISEYAKEVINSGIKIKAPQAIIHHGVSDRFDQPIKTQQTINHYSPENPFKLIYVSILDVYKHQIRVADIVRRIRMEGYPVSLKLIGGAYPPEKKRWDDWWHKNIDSHLYIQYIGKQPYDKLADHYKEADTIIFSSTCENMPNILIEGMKTGLPILCSNYPPMPEFLKDGGIYFDPLNENQGVDTLKKLCDNVSVRKEMARRSKYLSSFYKWEDCAVKTLNFLKYIYKSGSD